MAKKTLTLTALSSSLLAISGPALANKIDFSVGIESAYTDNANSSALSPISERQDSLSLLTNAEYKNNWMQAEVDYRISQLLFDKDSQNNRLELDGSARALFGQENGRFNLSLENSKRQVLGNAGELSLADNYQTRDVTSLLPKLNIFQDQADTLSITGIYSAVNFDQNESTQASFDTTSTGAQMAWRRNLSKVDSLSLIAQHQEIEYDDVTGQDYEYQSVVLRYATELRQFSYSVALGYNVAKPDQGSEDSSMQWEVSAAYDSGGNQVTVLSESYITDPSRGNNNSLLEDGRAQVALGNGSTSITDQYNRRAHTLSYTTSRICNLCTLTLAASYSTERYNVASDQDNEELLLSARGSYRLSRISDVGLSLTRQEADYEPGSMFSSYDSDTLRVTYNRRMAQNWDIQVQLTEIDRNGDTPISGYDETRVEFALNYRFE